jgi:hypothetical protein
MSRILLITFMFICFQGFAQATKKSMEAFLTQKPPVIDGRLDDECWGKIPGTSSFVEYEPYNNIDPKYQTSVKILYTQDAIFIAAKMYDDQPDSIMRQFSRRDQLGQTDFFGVTIDPFGDALTGFTFIVTPANVQFDARQTFYEDDSWDAVWLSVAQITEDGWTAELEIPYSMLRFPKNDEQVWSINFVRFVNRAREKSFWSAVDPKVSGLLNQAGVVTGIRGIDPPIRLSVTPYLAGYLIKNSLNSNYGYSIRGGMDLKFGLTDSYTLDMMLIPDFGQVESDNKVLNISPFETYFEEKRPFFTEGTELFNKGQIFYSRRIGATPKLFYEAGNALDSNQEIKSNPSEASLYNVTKITGKGINGLSIGFLNGISKPMYAIINDTISREETNFMTQPMTNYNVLVLDQALKYNSHISLINTNFYQPKWDYKANVTATDMRFETPKGKFAFEGIGAVSSIKDSANAETNGYKYYFALKKISDNFRFTLSQNAASLNYNQNDLGYLDKTNQMTTSVVVNYNIYEPWKWIMKSYNNISVRNFYFMGTNQMIGSTMGLYSFTVLKNYYNIEFSSEAALGEHKDFYEPRAENRYSIFPGWANLNIYVSPDYRKKAFVSAYGGAWKSYDGQMGGYWAGLIPTIRFNDHFNLNLTVSFDRDNNTTGFVGNSQDEDTIYYARRNMNTVTNSMNANLVFSENSALSLKLRHYWRYLDYSAFYILNQDGTLQATDIYRTDNINKNYFNVDIIYTWRFAPGSELSLVWKLGIDQEGNEIEKNYFDNLALMKGQGNDNSISLRVLYYLDYAKVKSFFKFGNKEV